MSQKITITIDKDGNPEIRTSGFTGPACKAATAGLERELGVVISDTATREMHDVPATVKVGGGVG